MRALPPALVAAMALLAGCAGLSTEAAGFEHAFTGTFTVLAIDAEMVELADRVVAEGGHFTFIPGLPPGFEARGISAHACNVVQGFALTRIYVDRVAACAPVIDAIPDEPGVSVPATGPVLASKPFP